MAALAYDIECYKNYFLVMFKNIENNKVRFFELRKGSIFDTPSVVKIIKKYQLIGFNNNNYDWVILRAALCGYDNSVLKEISDKIISGTKYWDIEKEYRLPVLKTDQIDIMEVAKGRASLKMYGARIGVNKIQDLPYPPDLVLSVKEQDNVRLYCENDLDLTIALFNFLRPQLELRDRISAQYQVDVRSKSDAQIAEAIFKQELSKLSMNVKKPNFPKNYSFFYSPPSNIEFDNADLKNLLEEIKTIRFGLVDGGIELPEKLVAKKIIIGDSEYKLGIGGLHSRESSIAYVGPHIIEDRDVASYYPNIILNNKYYPKHIGAAFQNIYKNIVDLRLKAKHNGQKVLSETYKIVLNGAYGKFGSKWSFLYSPDLLIHTTLTGQLSLLMLIEKLEQNGIKIYSANTDGIVLLYPKELIETKEAVIKDWEKLTNFETEGTFYRAIYSRDVNNYIAIKNDDAKAKGVYSPEVFLDKNTNNKICSKAIIDYLAFGIPVEETITSCTDILKFVSVRKVEGGGEKAGVYLGKVVRWYQSNTEKTPIRYCKNGNKVPESDNSRACMVIPSVFPDDIDYAFYINKAKKNILKIGGKV